MSCFAVVDFACSGRVEACGSTLRESCSAATGFATCSVICSAAGCSSLAGVEAIGVWTDEEILLKIFIQRPRRLCSSSESSSSTIVAGEGVEMAGYAGMADCVGLEDCTGVGEAGAYGLNSRRVVSSIS